MQTILHVSDIHAGAPFRPDLAELVHFEADELKPDVVVVSGDLVQHEYVDQYQRARRWLDGFRQPLIVIPGNHDVPFRNPIDRFFCPMEKFRHYIEPDPNPFFYKDDLAVLGLNSTRSFTVKGGKLGEVELDVVRERLKPLPPNVCRVVTAHHHFTPPPGFGSQSVISDAKHAIEVMEECDVELILSGHMHVSYIGNTLDFYPTSRRGIIIVQSGTTTSARGKQRERGKNSFNVIRIYELHISITQHLYDNKAKRFLPMSRHLFPRRLPGPYYLRVEDAAAAEVVTAQQETQVQQNVAERVQEKQS
ncbi:MAG: metallophosphoesterase [Anaerolineae bacterium]